MSVKDPSMASALAHCQETVSTMSSSARVAVISVPTLGPHRIQGYRSGLLHVGDRDA